MTHDVVDIVHLSKDSVYYLAGPFSSKMKSLEKLRGEMHRTIGGILLSHDITVIEPISTSLIHAEYDKLPTGYEFWKKRDRLLVSRSDGVIVIPMPGYEESVGTQDEIAYALDLGKPVVYLDYTKVLARGKKV